MSMVWPTLGSRTAKEQEQELHVICGLTACTPGSAPGPTLGNEYGKTLPFLIVKYSALSRSFSALTLLVEHQEEHPACKN